MGTAPDTDHQTVRDWVKGWSDEVAAVDIATARERFDAALVAFGTRADIVVGLDRVEAEQWAPTWPAIEDFEMLVDDAHVEVSDDRLMAVVAVGWTSTGIAEDANRFDRPGRATIVLRRSDVSAPWRGVHTHFSLARGVPQTTHGKRTVRR